MEMTPQREFRSKVTGFHCLRFKASSRVREYHIIALYRLINPPAFSRLNRGSDSLPASPGLLSPERRDTLDTPSHSRSRATSPLRLFQQWSAGRRPHHTREDPFIPINPFRHRAQFRLPCLPCFSFDNDLKNDTDINIVISNHSQHDTQCAPALSQYTSSFTAFITEILPRVIYLHILLRLPSLYFSRVARVFEDAEVSKPDIQRMIDAASSGSGESMWESDPMASASRALNSGSQGQAINSSTAAALGSIANIGIAPLHAPLPFPDDWTPSLVSPSLVRFKHSWEAFIDSVMREWKTLNVVSALLLS